MLKLVIVLGVLLLGGCYKMAPDDDALSTVPATNNPNILPGQAKSSPLPFIAN